LSKRKIKQGECIFSIAAERDVPWESIWNHPGNGELKQKRKLPNVLFPGDILFVPGLEIKEEGGDSEQKHTFRKKRPKTVLRLRLIYDGEPLKDTKYRLVIDGRIFRGKTDTKGKLEQVIEATAREGILSVHGDSSKHKLLFGFLDPVETTSGLQARLNNLGYHAGKVDGDWGGLTRAGMHAFQSQKDELAESSKPNDKTRNLLTKEYGS
jgi:hypothetical protein